MILRTVTRHVRDQNWVAVFLDFLIVVVGIFVGLQVTDWNAQRQAKEREHAWLIQLSEDLDAMRAEFAVITDRAGARSEQALRVFRALETCDRDRASEGDFETVFARYQNQRTATIVSRTYDEMVGSGALAEMDDRSLSGRIAGLFGGLETYVEFIDGVRVSLPVVDRVIWQNVDLSFDTADRPALGGFDFEAICQNRELRNAVWEIQDLFFDWELITTRAIEQLESTANALDAHLNKSDAT